jgi:hypothetical protein
LLGHLEKHDEMDIILNIGKDNGFRTGHIPNKNGKLY